MKHVIPVTALTATLLLATPIWSASAADGVKVVEGSDHGTFTTQQTDDHVLTQDSATGDARHIGHYTLNASEVINLGSLQVTEGEFTITTSRHTLVGTYSGQAAGTADPNVITYHASGPVLGGSGRFTGVTGWLTFDGVANLATGKLCDRVSGWISTPHHGQALQLPQLVEANQPMQACRL